MSSVVVVVVAMADSERVRRMCIKGASVFEACHHVYWPSYGQVADDLRAMGSRDASEPCVAASCRRIADALKDRDIECTLVAQLRDERDTRLRVLVERALLYVHALASALAVV